MRPRPADLVRVIAASLLSSSCAGSTGPAGEPAGRRSASSALPPLPPPSAALPATASATQACCRGLNTCKFRGGCAVDGEHECQGKNECRGRGGCNRLCP